MALVSFKEINRLAVPAIFAGIIEPLISITDTVVAGHLPEAKITLGAVGLAGALMSALVWILAQTKSAISAYVSQAYGAGRIGEVRPLFTQLFYFNLFTALLLLILTFFWAEQIFRLQNARGEILDTATTYFKIRVFGFPFTLLTFTVFGAFRGLQNTSWAMIISVTGGLINVLLDVYLGIYLDWGVLGIAYASLVAQIVMFVLAIRYVLVKTSFRFKHILPVHKDFRNLLTMSGNLFLRAAALNLTFYIANTYATSYGSHFIDAQAILIQIWMFSAFFLDGYANAANALAGRMIGEKSYGSLFEMGRKLSKFMLLLSLILMGIYFIIYSKIGGWFTHEDEIIRIFETYFWIVVLMQPINALAFLYDGIFKGMGEAAFLRNILLLATIVFTVVLFILDRIWPNLYAVWGAFTVWMLIRSFGLVFKLKAKVNKQNTH